MTLRWCFGVSVHLFNDNLATPGGRFEGNRYAGKKSAKEGRDWVRADVLSAVARRLVKAPDMTVAPHLNGIAITGRYRADFPFVQRLLRRRRFRLLASDR